VSCVIPFRRQRRQRSVPPLVFVDLHNDQLAETDEFRAAHFVQALDNCRLLLAHARREQWPIAFVAPLQSTGMRGSRRALWIPGFEPSRSDMVFHRSDASCYSSREFADAMSDAGSTFMLAGFSTEDACLATMIDAARMGQYVGLVTDASITRPLPGYSADDSHRFVVALAGRYAGLITARQWIEIAGTVRPDPEPEYGNKRYD
jgi:nicotinamidase-related amidase